MEKMTELLYNILYSDYIGEAYHPATLVIECEAELAELARLHRLEGLYKKAMARLDDGRLREYQSLAIAKYEKDYTQRRELNAILRKLEAQGIKYTLIKGFFLSRAYPELGLRELKDVDIIIDEQQIDLFSAVLKECGYRSLTKSKMDQSFVKPGCLEVEAHFKFWDDVWLSNRRIKRWKREWAPTEYVVENLSYNGIPMEDEFLNWMLHLKKHFICGSVHMRFLFDILYMDRHYSVDWDMIQAKAAKTGALKLCKTVRSYCRDGSLSCPEARALVEAVLKHKWGPEIIYPYLSCSWLMGMPVLGWMIVFAQETARGLLRRRVGLKQCLKDAAASTRAFASYSAAGRRVGLNMF